MVPKFGTSITIGCTGMLLDALLWVVERSEHTTIVSRNHLSNPINGNITKIDADWKDPEVFMVDTFSM